MDALVHAQVIIIFFKMVFWNYLNIYEFCLKVFGFGSTNPLGGPNSETLQSLSVIVGEDFDCEDFGHNPEINICSYELSPGGFCTSDMGMIVFCNIFKFPEIKIFKI